MLAHAAAAEACGIRVGAAERQKRLPRRPSTGRTGAFQPDWIAGRTPRQVVGRLLNSPAFVGSAFLIHGSSMAEQRTVNPLVVGSSPTRGARRSTLMREVRSG